MGELTTNRLWESVADFPPENRPSQYARMILGTPAVHEGTGASRIDGVSETPASARRRGSFKLRPRASLELILPHPAGDRFALYQSVVGDFVVVGLVWGILSSFSPLLGLPWEYLPIFGTLVTLFGFSEGLYRSEKNQPVDNQAAILARASLFAAGLVLLAAGGEIHCSAVLATLGGSVAGLVGVRGVRERVQRRSARETELRKVLIVGAGAIAHAVAQALRDDPLHRTEVRGFVDNDIAISPVVLGRIADLEWLARAEFIDEVILAIPGQRAQTREAAEIAYRNHLDIRAVPDLPPGPWADAEIERLGEIPIVTLHREATSASALLLKRLLDIAGAGFGLLFAAPVMAVVALLIRVDSPGPVIYSARRTGAKGRPFHCHKFRSMVTNADHLKEKLRERNQREGPIFKIDDDPRVTVVGRFIRRYSLDELPQLWNVLRGEMSLVGPRPHPVDEVNHYELQHYRRLDVKPGITGLWQITARDCPSFELNMHLDLTYIENWNLLLDLRILASTVGVLFRPEGA